MELLLKAKADPEAKNNNGSGLKEGFWKGRTWSLVVLVVEGNVFTYSCKGGFGGFQRVAILHVRQSCLNIAVHHYQIVKNM